MTVYDWKTHWLTKHTLILKVRRIEVQSLSYFQRWATEQAVDKKSFSDNTDMQPWIPRGRRPDFFLGFVFGCIRIRGRSVRFIQIQCQQRAR